MFNKAPKSNDKNVITSDETHILLSKEYGNLIGLGNLGNLKLVIFLTSQYGNELEIIYS